MSTLGHAVEAVRTKVGHGLDHIEDPHETYACARRRQAEMLEDVRHRLAEVEQERERTPDRATRERLADEQARLKDLERGIEERQAEFDRLIAGLDAWHGPQSARYLAERFTAESDHAEAEMRHCTDW